MSTDLLGEMGVLTRKDTRGISDLTSKNLAPYAAVFKGTGVHMTVRPLAEDGSQTLADISIVLGDANPHTLYDLLTTAGTAFTPANFPVGFEIEVTTGTLLMGRGGQMDGSVLASTGYTHSYAVNSFIYLGRCKGF